MKCQECCQKIENCLQRYSWIVPTLCRLTLGLIFIQTGWGKWHNLDHLTQFFGDLGIPFPTIQAPLVAGIELLSGIFLLAGIFSKLGAFFIMCIMAVAVATAKSGDIHGVLDVFGLQEWDYFVMASVVLFMGTGPWALNRFCCKNCKKT